MTDDPVGTARRAGRSRLTEPETKRLLAEAGVDVPDFEVVESAAAAAAAADRVGYPAVVKVVSPGVVHKSEWAGGRGVRLGLDSAAAVGEAAGEILTAAGDHDDGTAATGGTTADRDGGVSVLVEERVEADGTEVVVGASREPSFGPTVLVGAGGLFAEVHEDVAHRLAPLSRSEARRAVAELRVADLLGGYRTRPAADVDALADAVVAVGDLLADRDALATVDVNPVLATPDGAVALDAVAVLSEEATVGDGSSAGDGGSDAAGDGPDGGTDR